MNDHPISPLDFFCWTCASPRQTQCITISTSLPTKPHMSRIHQAELDREWRMREHRISPNTPI